MHPNSIGEAGARYPEAIQDRPDTALDHIRKRAADQLGRAHLIEQRVASILSRLTGPRAQLAEKNNLHPIASGFVDETRQTLEEMTATHTATLELLDTLDTII